MCLAKIIQRTLLLGIAIGCPPSPAGTTCRWSKKLPYRNTGTEYDWTHHREAQVKLCLEHASVSLETIFLMSSTTGPQNRQVTPGPVGFLAQGVEIEFVVSMLDPSATRRRVVLRVAAQTP